MRIDAQVAYGGFGTPVEHGSAVVQDAAGEQRVLFIGARDEAAARWPDAEVQTGAFAVSPPPVNAHVHLDLSRMPPYRGPYAGFIRAVVAHQRAGGRGPEAARDGLRALTDAGVTAFGDVVTSEDVMFELLGHEGVSGVAYWEVFAPDPSEADATFTATVERLRRFKAAERPGGMRVGLTPHTPHTVSAPLLQKLAQFAAVNALPLQVHVAESDDETALHTTGDGAIRDLMGPMLAHWAPTGLTPVAYLDSLGVLDARPSLVHAVHVSEEDVRRIARAGASVVHCPRSNQALACGRFPVELYARHGVDVAFGTDSLGSSPSLDVQAEVHAALEVHGGRANAGALVRAAVKGGRRALGLTPPRLTRGSDAAGLTVWPAPPRVSGG